MPASMSTEHRRVFEALLDVHPDLGRYYFGAVAVWYLVLTGIWSIIQASIERRLAASERMDDLTFRERLIAAWAPAGAFVRR